MTRIIAGTAGGRRLSTPRGEGTRPTSDRVREAVFSAVEHQLGALAGRRVLDLYAGSGAVGLEAVSRGAAAAVLVEHDRRAATVIRDNIRSTGLQAATLVVARVERWVRSAPAEAEVFDAAFLDPPYPLGSEAVTVVLRELLAGGRLAAGAVVVVERSSRSPEIAWPEGVEPVRSRRYGETCVWYGRVGDFVTPRS